MKGIERGPLASLISFLGKLIRAALLSLSPANSTQTLVLGLLGQGKNYLLVKISDIGLGFILYFIILGWILYIGSRPYVENYIITGPKTPPCMVFKLYN